MTSRRKTKLVDLNPHWVVYGPEGGPESGIYFDCPEGHSDCHHVIPFTPALDGSLLAMEHGRGWQRSGETFETLTLSPSILRRQHHASKEAALAAGVIEEYFTESLTCALHIFIKNGEIEFCGDSK